MIDNAIETNCDALRTMFILQQPSTVILLTVVAFCEGCPFSGLRREFLKKEPAACTGPDPYWLSAAYTAPKWFSVIGPTGLSLM
jgi:hypothetical protein